MRALARQEPLRKSLRLVWRDDLPKDEPLLATSLPRSHGADTEACYRLVHLVG